MTSKKQPKSTNKDNFECVDWDYEAISREIKKAIQSGKVSPHLDLVMKAISGEISTEEFEKKERELLNKANSK